MRLVLTRLLPWWSFLCLLLGARNGYAGGEPKNGSFVSTSLAFFAMTEDSQVLGLGSSLVLSGAYRFSNRLRIGGTWGGVWGSIETASFAKRHAIGPANLLLHADFPLQKGALSLQIGGRLGLPLALFWKGTIPDNRALEFSYLGAANSRGWRSPYLWEMNALAIIPTLRASFAFLEQTGVEFDLAPALLLSMNSRPSRFALQMSVAWFWRWSAFTGRLGWNAFVRSLPLENNDVAQHTLWLGVAWSLQPAIQMTLDGHLLLGAPYGVDVQSSPKPSWGITLGLKHSF